jgi:integrase
MGRPSLPLGTYGKIHFIRIASGQVQARTRFRDFDGQVRLIAKVGATRPAAERALKQDMVRRQTPPSGGAIKTTTRIAELADAWLDGSHEWSITTERLYRTVVTKNVNPAMGELRVQEVTPGVITRALRAIAARSGSGAAKTARSCLSGMFAIAVEDGAATINPVRDSSARVSGRRKTPRALTEDETEQLRGLFGESERAGVLDLPDVVDWMLGTGCRIGEALAAREGLNADRKPVLDLEAGTWEINATVVRAPRRGLIVQPRPKTKAGWRIVALPSYAVDLARGRLQPHGGHMLFPAPVSRELRDPNNMSNQLRTLLDGFECDECAGTGYRLEKGRPVIAANGRRVRCDAGPWSWVSSHTFRKTVATRLEEAGFTPRQVADQLGHANPSMTLDVYFGRHVVSSAAAAALDRPGRSSG